MTIEQETLKAFLEEFDSNIEICESNLVKLGQKDSITALSEMYRSMHSLKGAAMFVNLPKITELCHSTEDLLNSLATDVTHQDSTKLDFDFIKNILLKSLQELSKNIYNLKQFGAEDDSDHNHILAEIQEATNKCGVMRDVNKHTTTKVKKKRKLNKLQEKILASTRQNTEEQKENITEESTKVNKQTLENIQKQIANLNYIKNNLLQAAESKNFYDKSLTALDTATERLNQIAIEANLVPLQSIATKLKKATMELALSLGKKIELIVEGEFTQLNKDILSNLYDPLIHMLRNSIDHGIAMPEQRKLEGKNEVGKIIISAHNDGSWVYISIKDDGQGINQERIIAKALEQKIYTRKQLNAMSEEQILDIIFEPKFSTKDKVSQISGRGVGMDVVKDYITKINGKMSLNSIKGQGTEILIRVPLHTAINKFIIVHSLGMDFAIPEALVQELYLSQNTEVQATNNGYLLQLREEQIPLIKLDEFLRHLQNKDISSQMNKVFETLIVKTEEQRFAIGVDAIEEAMDLIIKGLDLPGVRLQSTTYQFFTGATLLSSGHPALILNVEELISFYKAQKTKELVSILPQEHHPIEKYHSQEKLPKGSLMHFKLGNLYYAIDYQDVQEAIYGYQIHPVPGLESELSGIINLRGEIIKIKNLGEQTNDTALILHKNNRTLVISVDEIIGLADTSENTQILNTDLLLDL